MSTKEWVLPSEKACFYTYGVNYSAYIIEDEYLFSLNANINTDGSVEYDFYLSHYVDGVVTESENDPLLFKEFIKQRSKGLTNSVKPFLLKQCRYPVNQAIHHTCRHAIHDHRAGDGKHFRADAQDEALCLWSSRTH